LVAYSFLSWVLRRLLIFFLIASPTYLTALRRALIQILNTRTKHPSFRIRTSSDLMLI
jgi:hypothetical protein